MSNLPNVAKFVHWCNVKQNLASIQADPNNMNIILHIVLLKLFILID